ncbi:ankyrin repeat domain-containing protein 40-like isoform X2 [Portunus trituberculatus]|nr:ankyrin repeat domain-containing protein 40-like isoform X2 [Portunus trituberculatus]XP_045135894.1 ankyrin repeat domain-containing protein 40-like isoform X2 [Portunus trituberculatus]XP_045135895.1 ankyrin repeat domain-containing protein 40-like isoform X2 [Portunus trituberculatus]
MSNGADAEIENNQAQKPANLTTSAQILQLIGAEIPPASERTVTNTDSLPITPNYLANPPVDYKVPPVNPVGMKNPFGKPLANGIETADSCTVSQYGNGVAVHPSTQAPGSNYLQDSLARQNKEIVLKVRLAHSDDPDFIEIEFQKAQINYSSLLTTCCREMAVNPQLVERIRKLPNTRLRNDKDVQRLTDYTELELVMKGQSRPPVVRSDTQSTSKNNYSSIHGFKNQTILY